MIIISQGAELNESEENFLQRLVKFRSNHCDFVGTLNVKYNTKFRYVLEVQHNLFIYFTDFESCLKNVIRPVNV